MVVNVLVIVLVEVLKVSPLVTVVIGELVIVEVLKVSPLVTVVIAELVINAVLVRVVLSVVV